MSDRVIELFNSAKFEQGDAILEFLPNEYARSLLDWYFDETNSAQAPSVRKTMTAPTPAHTQTPREP